MFVYATRVQDRFTDGTRPGFTNAIAARLELLNNYRNQEWAIYSVKNFHPAYGLWLPRMTTGFDRSSRYTSSFNRSRDVVIRVIASMGYNGFYRDGKPRDRVSITFCPVLEDDESRLGTLLEGLSNPRRGTRFLMVWWCVMLMVCRRLTRKGRVLGYEIHDDLWTQRRGAHVLWRFHMR